MEELYSLDHFIKIRYIQQFAFIFMKNKKLKIKGIRKSALQTSREFITKRVIASMKVIDSCEFLKLLYDRPTGNYIVFNNYGLNSLYSKDYRVARRFFEKQANNLY